MWCEVKAHTQQWRLLAAWLTDSFPTVHHTTLMAQLGHLYRKSTHPDKYLDYCSRHPLQHKAGVKWTRFTRARCLSLTAVKHSSEVNHLVSALMKNGYLRKMIDEFMMVHQSRRRHEDEEERIMVTLLYIRGTSETQRWILTRANIKQSGVPSVFHLHWTIGYANRWTPQSSHHAMVIQWALRSLNMLGLRAIALTGM